MQTLAAMNLREALLEEHSKQQTNKIVLYIGADQKKFDELMQVFFNSPYRLVQHAAWPISYIVIAHPNLITKHLPAIVALLRQPNIHNAVKRNIVRFLQEIDIPEELHGQVMDVCFAFVADPREAVAVKAFSLTVLDKLREIYPDITGELKTLIETRLPNETAAFKSRAGKILARMEKGPGRKKQPGS